jgi:hypothetical protein
MTDIETSLRHALDYYDRGLMVVPTQRVIAVRDGRPVCSCASRDLCPSPGKHPALAWAEFQKRRPSRDEISEWWAGDRARLGVGILTGAVSGNIFVVDVDVGPGKDGDDSLRALQMAHDDLPETAEVRTGSGGRHLYFRAPAGVAVIRNSAGKLGPGLDIRGEGGFVVAPPSVHASGQPYVWSWQNTLDVGIADAPGWLLDLVRADAPVSGAAPRERAPVEPLQRPAGAGSTGGLEPPVDDGREQYMRDTVHAVGVQLTGENGAWPIVDELFEIAWPQYMRRVDLSRPGRITADNVGVEMRAKCISWVRKAEAGGFGALEDVVAGYQGRKRSDPRQGPGNRQEEPSSDAGQFEGVGEGAASGGEDDLARPFVLRSPSEIPRRRWLYGSSYIRSFVSVLAAPGGAGKTTLYVVESLSIATGKALLGVTPAERVGVWVMNLEDPADEMERRIGAAAKHYGIAQRDIEGRLFVDAGREKPLTIAYQTRDGITIHQPIVDAIVEKIRRHKIGVLIVDPFVASHSVPENDNQAINAVLALWRLIADLTGCCIVLVHHFRKLNGEEGSIDSVRGGTAIIGAVRTARVMNTMSDTEAVKLGIDEAQRRRYVRIDDAKNNLAPPADKAQWIELVSVDLGNGSGIAPEGDKVGVATLWEPPSVWDGVTEDHMRAVHNLVHRDGGKRQNPQAAGWLGFDVIRICGFDDDAGGRAKAKTLLSKWVHTGVLKVEKQQDKTEGRAVPVYVAGTLPPRTE